MHLTNQFKTLLVGLWVVSLIGTTAGISQDIPAPSSEGLVPTTLPRTAMYELLPPTEENSRSIVTILPSTGATSTVSRAPQGSQRYIRTAWIISAAEMATSGYPSGETATSIGFDMSVAQSIPTTGGFKVYLQNTSDTAFSKSTTWDGAGGTIDGMTLVHDDSITIPAATGTYDVPFLGGSAFVYTGGALYLAFEYQNPSATLSTANTARCNNTLVGGSNGLRNAASTTTLPTTLTSSSAFRPSTRLGNTLVDIVALPLIYTLGKIPIPLGNPDIIGVLASNVSGSPATFDVTITVKNAVTGAVRHTETQTVTALAAGTSQVVSFSGWSPALTEDDSIIATTSAIAGETDLTNNTKAIVQNVNVNTFSYSLGSTPTGGVGFNGATGDFVAQFTTNGPALVDQVQVNFNGSGQPYAIGIWDATGPGGVPGSNIWTSDTLTSAVGVSLVPVSPAVPVNGSFFVGVRQLGTANVSFSYQSESPIRAGTFYFTSPTGGTVWTDFSPGSPFRFMIEPRVIRSVSGGGIFSSTTERPILDNTAALDTINIPGALTIGRLQVMMDSITHTWAADLDVFLFSPSGDSIELFTDVGGSGDNFRRTFLTDTAATSISTVVAANAPFTGAYRPEATVAPATNLAFFNNSSAQGNWVLRVFDDAGGDQGTLHRWSLWIDSAAGGTHDIGVTSLALGSSANERPSLTTGSREIVNALNRINAAELQGSSDKAAELALEGLIAKSTTPRTTVFSVDDTVRFDAAVRNFGNFTENSYQVGWSIDGSPQTPVNNTDPLDLGDTDTLSLQWNTGTVGMHTARAWSILAGDGNASNDSSGAISFEILPSNVLLSEGFNGGTFPPAGWTTINRDGGGSTGPWFAGNTGVFPPYEGAGYAGDNFQSGNGLYIDDYLITPNTGGTSRGADVDSLTFWARSNSSTSFPDSLMIMVSTTGSDTASFTTVLDYFRVPDSGWTRFAYELPVGADRYVAFRYLHYDGGTAGNNSDYIGVDDVRITRHTTGVSDIGVISVAKTTNPEPPARVEPLVGNDAPSTGGLLDNRSAETIENSDVSSDGYLELPLDGQGIQIVARGSLSDTVRFRAIVENFGTLAEATYQVRWDANGIVQGTLNNTGTLAVGGRDTMTFAWSAPPPGTHTVRAWTILAADANPANDTSSVSFTVAPIIYNNGGLSTGPVAKRGTLAPAGTNWSEAQNPANDTTQSNSTAGFSGGITTSTRFRLADDFTVPPGEAWAIDSIFTYAYQTGNSGVTSPFISANFRIWDGIPDSAGSSIVFGDTTTNRLGASVNAALYRIFNSRYPTPGSTPGTTRPIWRNTLVAGVTLGPGTYWLDWTTEITASASHFAPSVTIEGQRGLPGWNARQRGGAGWISIVDGGTPASAPDSAQDMPFALIGAINTLPPGFFDDFEAYTVGQQLACQNPVDWTTWSIAPCNVTEDPLISSNFAYSGTKSVVIVQNNDLVKRLGSLTTGKQVLKFKAYIPAGKAGYFNTLAGFTPNPFNWAMETYFDANSSGRLFGGSATPVTFPYTQGAWQDVQLVVNLDSNRAEFSFNGTLLHTWQWTLGASGGGSPLRLDGVDFFGATAGDEMYVDDFNAYTDSGTVDVKEGDPNVVPETFALLQNYPNPFNPVTTIRFGVPTQAFVTVKLYNILGQEIATLVNEEKSAGFHNTTWNGRNQFGSQISSGVYFYRMEARSLDGSKTFIDLKKMMLLK